MPTPLFGKLFAQPVAIDPGTASTRIYTHERGVVLNQPSVVCFHKAVTADGRAAVAAVGELAKALLGREPAHLEAVKPMQNGVIADAHAAQQMIRSFIDMSQTRSRFGRRVDVTLCVPSDATAVERRAIRDAAFAAGVSDVELIDESLAAALGAGLPVTEPVGSMVVDIGGGTTEVGVISLGGIVYKGSVRVGGDKFDEAIVNYIRRNYGMLIGEQTAEAIKKEIGSAFPGSEVKEMEVKGRNLSEGIPRSFTISSNEILEALTDPLNQIVSSVKIALEQTPPELGADIAERGMMLTGGGALLRDLDRLLAEETGLPVLVAEDPLTCVVRGSGMALERMDKLGSIFSYE